MCAGLVVIVSLKTALGSLKEERKMKKNNLRGRQFRFTALETSVSHAKGIFKLSYIPLLGGCYGKSCKLNGQHTRTRNHSAISPVVIALHKLLHCGPGLMIFNYS